MHLLCSGMQINYLEKFYLLGLVIRFVWTLFGGVLIVGLIIIEVRLSTVVYQGSMNHAFPTSLLCVMHAILHAV